MRRLYVYDIFNYDSSGQLVIRVNPVPTDTDSLIFYMVNPLRKTLADDSTTKLLVPKDPVIQLAYLKAINERGEDSGRASEIQEKIYRSTLAEAISQDDIHSSGNSLAANSLILSLAAPGFWGLNIKTVPQDWISVFVGGQ